MELRESETFRNLIKAYQGELQASGKYRIYAKQAREEGYMNIADIFEETSGNEERHAELWQNVLNGGRYRKPAETWRRPMRMRKENGQTCMRLLPKKRSRRL